MKLNIVRVIFDKLLVSVMQKKTCLHLPKVLIFSNVIEHATHMSTFMVQAKWFSKSSYLQAQADIVSKDGKEKTAVVDYNEILQAQKDDNILIIDVREQSEINETGKLPGSIHIPMGDVINSLKNFSEQEFLQRYNKKKPSKSTKIILSCRSGKRSQIVQEELQKIGYTNTYNYIGGWLDWESNQK